MASRSPTQEDNNPHKRLHAVVFYIVIACLTAQVIEGTLIAPYILVHFGFPDLSLKEICDEMYIIVYKDEDRECNFPYPLFAGPEVWKYKDMAAEVGYPVPPKPNYEGYGWRETVQRRKDRLARQAAAKAAAEKGTQP